MTPDSKSQSVRQSNLWTKGGRARCIGRIGCCLLMTTVFLVVSIVLALALFIRPPSIIIKSTNPLLSSSAITDPSNGISLDVEVRLAVNNPNYFNVDLKKIKVEIFYPIENTPVGGGTTDDIDFKSLSQTNFTFPFTLGFNSSQAQAAGPIFSDLASKCGVTGDESDLNIDYKITLSIRIYTTTLSPVIASTFSFPCPISAQVFSEILGGLGVKVRSLD